MKRRRYRGSDSSDACATLDFEKVLVDGAGETGIKRLHHSQDFDRTGRVCNGYPDECFLCGSRLAVVVAR